MGHCPIWSVFSEGSASAWSVDVEAVIPSWSTLQETADQAFAMLFTECAFASDLGYILRTPDGASLYRLGVDNDGTPLSTGLGATYVGDEPELSLAGSGVVIQLMDGSYGRMRVDNDGALVAEPVVPVGWIIKPDTTLDVNMDVMIDGLSAGLLCWTPDLLHRYRVRLDNDGAFISEIIT